MKLRSVILPLLLLLSLWGYCRLYPGSSLLAVARILRHRYASSSLSTVLVTLSLLFSVPTYHLCHHLYCLFCDYRRRLAEQKAAARQEDGRIPVLQVGKRKLRDGFLLSPTADPKIRAKWSFAGFVLITNVKEGSVLQDEQIDLESPSKADLPCRLRVILHQKPMSPSGVPRNKLLLLQPQVPPPDQEQEQEEEEAGTSTASEDQETKPTPEEQDCHRRSRGSGEQAGSSCSSTPIVAKWYD